MASFFKVLTPEFLHNVFIPRAFVAPLSGEKMKVAQLTSPKGNQSWLVSLRKGEKELYYFKEGWIEFMNAHDLKIGEVLLFEHKGGWKFDVLIFGESYCEKTKFPDSLLKKIKEERSIDDDAGEKEDLIKEERSGDEDEDEDEAEEPKPQCRSSHNARNPKRDQSAIEAAKAYKPPSPHFMATIHTSNLNYPRPYFNIPSPFVSHIEQATSPMENVITIRDPDQGMTWSVKFHYRRGYSGTNAGKRMFLSAGWNDFSVSRNLKVGDVCVFELDTEARENGIIILDVHIFRG